MKPTQVLHDLGQSLWLDNITRNLLRTGVLRHYIDELSVTGLTSNPTIFDHAIKNSDDYDGEIRSRLAQGKAGERLFFELALEDLTEAADLFRPTELAALDARLQCRRPSAAPVVGQHRHQRPEGFGRALRPGSGGAIHGQHDP